MDQKLNLHWSSASETHVGMVRKLNEDACLELAWRDLWAVADGMGGHSAGDFASRMIVDALREVKAPGSLAGFVVDVKNTLRMVNRQLTDEASHRQVQLIGSTVAALLAFDNQCACVWAGDSRIYLYRGSELRQLTRDHSRVEELISRGILNRDEAKNYPDSNAITRAVGAMEVLDVDSRLIDVQSGDIFLLCTDGLYNEVSIEDMKKLLGIGDCRESARRLVQSALDHGARDNVSVVVARADDDSQMTKTVLNMNKTPAS
jgi:protein phosphatase